MTRYRKRPIVVDAIQLTGEANGWDICDWAPGMIVYDPKPQPHLLIQTLEGVMTGNPGDWVIRGVQGEYYPCRDDIFQQTYEPVADMGELSEPWRGPYRPSWKGA